MLTAEQKASLASAVNGKMEATVISRYALDESEKATISAALERCLGKRPWLTFKLDDTLVAGLRIEVGTATIDANVGSELAWFAQTESNAAG